MQNDVDLSRILREHDDELGFARLERRVRASVRAMPERRERRRRIAALGASASAVAMCVVAWTMVGATNDVEVASAPGPLFVVGTPPAPFSDVETHTLRDVELTDGSRLVLAPETEVYVDENTGERVGLRLERGNALFAIRPGGPRRWVIDAGPVTIEVLGTEFEVMREPSRITVSVERGLVRVYGEVLERERQLRAGDVLTIDLEARAASGPRDVSEAADTTPLESESTTDTPRSATPSITWRALAERGDVEGAHRLLGRGRLAEIARTTSSAEELFLLADIARRAGTPAEAIVPLERILEEHPRDPRTPLAALTLGRVLDDQLGRHSDAAEVFTRAAELGLPDQLVAVARERAFDAFVRGGRTEGARRAATVYLEEHPQGGAAARITRWLEGSEAP